jgi:PrpF protein/Tannase and feruloyl esterase
VAHCGGGRGPSELDLLTPRLAWVETGTAPGEILTASTAEVSTFGQPDGVEGGHGGMPPPADLGVATLPEMTRRVWPWTATAAFGGMGDATDSEGWVQGPDADTVALRDWAEAHFLARDLPAGPAARDALLRNMGSLDPCQIDGIGGADPMKSKVAILSPSQRPDADVDYLLLRVFVD